MGKGEKEMMRRVDREETPPERGGGRKGMEDGEKERRGRGERGGKEAKEGRGRGMRR